MAQFVKLTALDNAATYPNLDMATGMSPEENGTMIHFRAGEYVKVRETPEQILALLNTQV